MSKRHNPSPYSPYPTKEKEPLIVPLDQAVEPVFQESKLLDALGITKKYVLNEYMKVVNQDDDLSNKLKALKPLVKEIGIDIDGTIPGGITNNIIVMPAEITKKFGLNTNIMVGDNTEETITDITDKKDIIDI